METRDLDFKMLGFRVLVPRCLSCSWTTVLFERALRPVSGWPFCSGALSLGLGDKMDLFWGFGVRGFQVSMGKKDLV